MNNKIIICSVLLLLTLSVAKGHSAESCLASSSKSQCVQIVVKSNHGTLLKDIVVYLEPLEGQALEKAAKEADIGQRGKAFTPYLSVSQIGSQVNFVNQDDITHHIYSAGSDNKFSFKIRAGQKNSLTQFDHASEVAMGCNIHDWMSGYLLVVNTPYFGKTDELGQLTFTLKEQGKYSIVVWHPQMQSDNNRMIKEKIITMNTTVTFELTAALAELPLQKSNDDFDFLSDY